MSILTRRIGDTDVFVSQISFGCASIGNLYRQVSDADVAVVLEQAWQAGIRYFDTAPHYGRGLSEQRLGRFLREKSRRDYALSTKVGRVLSPGLPMREADGFASPLPNAVHYDYSAQELTHRCKAASSGLEPITLTLCMCMTSVLIPTALKIHGICRHLWTLVTIICWL